jgi:hypothetical protein
MSVESIQAQGSDDKERKGRCRFSRRRPFRVSEGLCSLVPPDIAQERTSVALRLPRTADAALAFETPVGGSVRGWGTVR